MFLGRQFHHQHPGLKGLGITNVMDLTTITMQHPEWVAADAQINELFHVAMANNQAQLIAYANANNLYPYEVAEYALSGGQDPVMVQMVIYSWLFGIAPLDAAGNIQQDISWLQDFIDGGGNVIPPPRYVSPYPAASGVPPPVPTLPPGAKVAPGYVLPMPSPTPAPVPIYLGPAPTPAPAPGTVAPYFTQGINPLPTPVDAVYVAPVTSIPGSPTPSTPYVAPYVAPAPAPATLVWGSGAPAPAPTAAPVPVTSSSGGIVTSTYDASRPVVASTAPQVFTTVTDQQGNPVQVPLVLTAPVSSTPSTPVVLPQNIIPAYSPAPAPAPAPAIAPAPAPAISANGGQVIDTSMAPVDTSSGSSAPLETLNPAAAPAAQGGISPLVLALAALVFVTAIK